MFINYQIQRAFFANYCFRSILELNNKYSFFGMSLKFKKIFPINLQVIFSHKVLTTRISF